jgi:hypothetical protein
MRLVTGIVKPFKLDDVAGGRSAVRAFTCPKHECNGRATPVAHRGRP